MNNDTIPKFLTTNEIAEILKMNVQVIARKLQSGEIQGYKIGKDWRVKEPDFWAWLEKHKNNKNLSDAEKVVGRFMRNGVFETLPAQRKRLGYILDYILNKFEINRTYTEPEVNETIAALHEDYCRIRREFVDNRMMYRKEGVYRRNSSYKPQK